MNGPVVAYPDGTSLLAGRYAFVDVLGSGGMGSVWRVWDARESRYRAVKLLKQQRKGAAARRPVDEPATPATQEVSR